MQMEQGTVQTGSHLANALDSYQVISEVPEQGFRFR